MKKNIIKVLHIFGKLDRGGAELRTIELIDKFDNNYEFHICSLSGKSGSLDSELIDRNIIIHYLNIKNLKFILKFIMLLRKENFNIVHSHVLFMSGLIQTIAFMCGVKGRITHFRTSKDQKENSCIRKTRNIILRILTELFSTNILYVSKTAKKNLFKTKIFTSKHQVIYNGYDISKFYVNNKSLEFVYVARFNENKNQKFLIEVIERYKNKFKKNIHITFIGNYNNEYGRSFVELMKNKNLEENITLVGEVNNVNEYLSSYKFFLFPTKVEGLPGSLIEAHLLDCIVICSDIPENIEVNEYFKETSINIPLKVDKWTDVLNQLVNNKKYYSKVSGHKSVFDINNTYTKMKKIYENYK